MRLTTHVSLCILFFASALYAPNGTAAEAAIRLATLEWPPHASRHVRGQGNAIQRVRSAFEHDGGRLEVIFRPWRRAVAATERGDDEVVGFLPEYSSEATRARWLLSSPIGQSPLGFVERSDSPVNWRQLEDLAGLRIGVVGGYVNERRFDELASSGALTTESAIDDLTNVRKVASGRLDIAVIDANVLHYLLTHHSDLRRVNQEVQLNAKLLEVKTLHVAFRRDAAGRAAFERLERGLKATADYQAKQPPRDWPGRRSECWLCRETPVFAGFQ